jgi:dTDP-4-dehydrorhamnose 3,5-epimerase
VDVVPTRLEGPIVLAPAIHHDARGLFQETFRRDAYAEVGITEEFVQDNHSRSRRGVVRGMHFQGPPGQAKLVRCVHGAIFDVVVDIRPGSPAFGQWEAHELSGENLHQVYIPPGFAHGFCVLTEAADVTYKVSTYYDPAIERGFRFDDPGVGIDWPWHLELDVSPRDRRAPLLLELHDMPSDGT